MSDGHAAWRPDIEGLRAIAVTLVVGYHYAGEWISGGYVGVDAFFVISGYLITQTLLRLHGTQGPSTGALAHFWARRARRLLPHALLVLAVAGLVAAWWLPVSTASQLGDEIAWAAGYALNWLFVVRANDYLRWGESAQSGLLNYWSLAVEEQFYLAWPALLLALLGRPEAARLRLAGAVTASLFVLSLGANLWWAQSGLTFAFFASPLRAWELLVGAVLALHAQSGRPWPVALARHGPGLAWLGLAGMVWAAITFDHDTSHPGLPTLVPVAATAMLIAAAGASPRSVPSRLLGSSVAQAIGARSYAIYLWHWPVLVLGSSLMPPWPTEMRSAVLLGLSVALAELGYRWVEAPVRWRLAPRARNATVLTIAVTASATVMAAGLALGEWARERVASAPASVAERPVGLPPLAVTQADLPVVYANGCHVLIEADAPSLDCRFGPTTAPPAVALIGDSHAAQWVPAIVPAAQARGTAIWTWTKSGCPFSDVTVWNAEARAPYRECDRWREAVLAELRRARSTAVVVSNLMDDETQIVDKASGALLRGRAAQAAMDAGVVRLLSRLRQAGHTVVLIRDTPRARPDILACLYSQTVPSACERSRREAVTPNPREGRIAASAKVVLWDFSDRICGPDRCPVFMEQERRAIYRDSTHLSATFAATLGAAVAERWAATPGLP